MIALLQRDSNRIGSAAQSGYSSIRIPIVSLPTGLIDISVENPTITRDYPSPDQIPRCMTQCINQWGVFGFSNQGFNPVARPAMVIGNGVSDRVQESIVVSLVFIVW